MIREWIHSIKNNYSTLPLVAVVALGLSFATISTIHTITKSPDVNLTKSKDPLKRTVNKDGTLKSPFYYTTEHKKHFKIDEERPNIYGDK